MIESDATGVVKAGEVEPSITRFAQGVLGKQAFEGLPEGVRAHMRANASTHVGQALADGGFEPITESQIASVTNPALVISGANSPVMFRRLAGLPASLLPSGRMVNVPEASHAMHVQNPTAVNAALSRFLAEHTSCFEVGEHSIAYRSGDRSMCDFQVWRRDTETPVEHPMGDRMPCAS